MSLERTPRRILARCWPAATWKRPKGTFDSCIDQMAKIPRNRPVAFRMPCCDSLNTVSPRFFAEIFNGTHAGGQLPGDRFVGASTVHAQRSATAARSVLDAAGARAISPLSAGGSGVRQPDRRLSLSRT